MIILMAFIYKMERNSLQNERFSRNLLQVSGFLFTFAIAKYK